MKISISVFRLFPLCGAYKTQSCSIFLPRQNQFLVTFSFNFTLYSKWHSYHFPLSLASYFALLSCFTPHHFGLKHVVHPASLLSLPTTFLTPFSSTKITLHALLKTSTLMSLSFRHPNPSLDSALRVV